MKPHKISFIWIINYYKQLFSINPEMEENKEFNFAQEAPKSDIQFKKQRAVYLAERNARKIQAQALLKKEQGLSSSSDPEDEIPIKQIKQIPKFTEQIQDTKTNTSIKEQSQKSQDKFQIERQKYKAERKAHRQELTKNKIREFGPSSSSQDGSVPTYIGQIKVIQPPRLHQSPDVRRNSKQEFESNPFCSLDLGSSLKLKHTNLQPSAKLKTLPAEHKSYKECYDIQIQSKKGTNIWVQQFLLIKDNYIEIAQRNIPLYDVTKTKLFFSSTQSGSMKMKVTIKDTEDVYFAVNPKTINQFFLDHYYYVFAKIVSLKLQLMGKKSNTETRTTLGLTQQQLKGAQITGKVRKSSFFGGWQQKIGVINQAGLFIYKQGKDKPIMIIQNNSIQQLWTRFDFDNQNLIVKFLHNKSKVQLSIPFENFMGRDNFLYHIYNLASK